MSWRTVVVSSNAKVDYKMDYLMVRTAEATTRIHMDEISVLLLESTAIAIPVGSVALLYGHMG